MFTTRKITYIATLTTASVSIVIILASLTPLAIYPSIRIAFEGVLVKLTGYLFGTIFGIITAVITEFLLILFKPGIIHWVYTLTIILYGIFGGFAFLIRTKTKNPVKVSLAIIIISLVAVIGVTVGLGYSNVLPAHIRVAGIIVNKWWIIIYFIFFAGLGLLFIFLGYVFSIKSKKIGIFYLNAMPIFLLSLLTELTSIFLLPYGDASALSGGTDKYSFWMTFSLLQSPIRLIFNVIIIYTGWKILNPLVRINQKPSFEVETNIDNNQTYFQRLQHARKNKKVKKALDKKEKELLKDSTLVKVVHNHDRRDS